MRIIINGKTVEAPQMDTVADLADWIGLPSFGSAVELNGAVIRKSDHSNTPLKESDCLEIVRLVGGG
ncbi:MAG: sulfur carrier protein ThiS [Holophagales bacterium]|nr:sulfur carrier protein ThiS [Holophagales bacterium]